MQHPDIEPHIPRDLADCRLCIIGEAPGADEVKQGRPFVGRAGQLLDRALATLSVRREDCYISNVFWCRPPQNKVDWFFGPDGDGVCRHVPPFRRRYLKSEWEGELARLRGELEILRPSVVLALGATALWAFTGREKIGMFRGRKLPIHGGGLGTLDILIIPTWHPAYVLRNPAAFDEMCEDVRIGLEASTSGIQ